MNTIKVKINFEKRTNSIIGVDLTSGDYNSTKMIFDFDREDGIKVFELKNPKGELVFSKEIENNEIVLTKVEEDGTFSSIFDMAGDYIFEVSLYANEGKLTSDYAYLPVELEQVIIGDTISEPYLPIFDELIQKLNNAIIETNNLDLDIENSVITITKKDGTVKTENVKGDSYIITDEDKKEIEMNVKVDIQPVLDEATEKSETAISISKGANQSIGFKSYEDVAIAFNVLPSDTYRVGQNVYVKTQFVPDLWVYEVFEDNIPYIYTNDEDFIVLLNSESGIRIGYYSLGALETQKVNLTDYVKNTDYATLQKGGVVKTGSSYGLAVGNSGLMNIVKATDSDIDARTHKYRPIVPNNLEYAVTSVVGNHIVLTQTEYEILEKNGIIDENTFYYIVEE